MPNFQLRSTRLRDGQPSGSTLYSETIEAESAEKASERAKEYPIEWFVDAGDYVWLTDDAGATVWSMKYEVRDHA